MKKLYLFLAISMYFLIAVPVAHADIFGPKHENVNYKINAKASDSLSLPLDPITVVGEISDKLGTKEGVGLDKWGVVNYAATTLYTYNTFVPIGFNIGAINTDGVGETVDFNLGSVLPADNDPLTSILKYAWVGGGVDERYIDNNWKASWLVDVQIKFAFN